MRINSFKLIIMIGLSVLVAGCVQTTFAWSALKPKGQAATPPIFTAGDRPDIETWETIRSPKIWKELQASVYGMMPDAESPPTTFQKTILDSQAFGGRGQLEEYVIRAHASFNGVTRQTRPFILDLVVPNKAQSPVPVILLENFSPRWAAIKHPKVSRPPGIDVNESGMASGLIHYVFGRYIDSPPIAEILDRGYAIGVLYPSEFIPDNSTAGLKALRNLSEGHTDDSTRWGAIAAWGWGFSRTIDALEDDPRFLTNGYIAYGHSRYGKAALIAGATDNRVGAVIAHQSGTGGASLNRRKRGESVKSITKNYPHWFSQSYAGFADREEALPIDQHHLLSLIAPRPILLGNARRDVWSDPNGALKAAIGADPVWKLYGPDSGLDQQKFYPYKPQADIALWMRPGTHGVVEEDWPAFLDFLDAHF